MAKTSLNLNINSKGYFTIKSSRQCLLDSWEVRGFIIKHSDIVDVANSSINWAYCTILISRGKPLFNEKGKEITKEVVNKCTNKCIKLILETNGGIKDYYAIKLNKMAEAIETPYWVFAEAFYRAYLIDNSYLEEYKVAKPDGIEYYPSAWKERDDLRAEMYETRKLRVIEKRSKFLNVYVVANNYSEYLTLKNMKLSFIYKGKKVNAESIRERYKELKKLSVLDTFGKCDQYNNGVFDEDINQKLELLFARYGYAYFIKPECIIYPDKDVNVEADEICDYYGVEFFANKFCDLDKIEELLPTVGVVSIGDENYLEGFRMGEIDIDLELEVTPPEEDEE